MSQKIVVQFENSFEIRQDAGRCRELGHDVVAVVVAVDRVGELALAPVLHGRDLAPVRREDLPVVAFKASLNLFRREG